jgi:hypothetical protein
MDESEWQLSFPTGNWVTTRRGIRIVITRNDMGEPSQVEWFIGGQLVESTPFDEDLKAAKHLAIDLVNYRMETDERWQQAERDGQSDIDRMVHQRKRD